MAIPDATLNILTLGRFSILADKKPLEVDWPNETVKVLFCSLLSPLDLYLTWDRICRSMLGIPLTRTSKQRMEQILIQPLSDVMIKQLGFNPLLLGDDGIRIDLQGIRIDAHDFHSAVVQGIRLSGLSNHTGALEKFSLANELYVGNFLPGIPGKIIENARADLESLHRTALMSGLSYVRNSDCIDCIRNLEPTPVDEALNTGDHTEPAKNA